MTTEIMLTFGETWTKETGDLLDEGFRRKESIVFFSELLDKLLVFVQPIFLRRLVEQIHNKITAVLFQIVNRHIF